MIEKQAVPDQFTPKLFSVLKSGYCLRDFRMDVLAGLTVAIVALPLAMALGIASGASPDKGLITAVIAGFLISFLGGSRVQIGGPTGAFVIVVFNVIAQHGYDGLVLATLMAGFILVIAGYARFGRVIRYIPHPVITGFTAGIAVIIATSQVKDFMGLDMKVVPSDFIPKWMAYFGAMGTISFWTLVIGVGALVFIIGLRKVAPKFPGYLLVVIGSSALVALFHLPVETIGSRFPDIPAGLPLPAMPEISFAKMQQVLPSAFTIAFLAGIEALLSAVVADGMTGFRHRSNQELVAQGVANIASAFWGGLPATGAIARTATNIRAGGRTPVSGIFHAIFLLAFVMFAMDLMVYVPMAALAAILFIVAWGMSEIGHFIRIFKLSLSDRTVLLLTFFLTILVDLTVAIGVGVTLASLLFVARMSESVEIVTQTGNEQDRDEDDAEDQRMDLPVGVEVFCIAGPVFFGVAGDLADTLKRIGKMPKVLILRMKWVPFLDGSGVESLAALARQCCAQGTTVIFSSVQEQPFEMLSRSDIGPRNKHIRYVPDYKSAIALASEIVQMPSSL
ncbi:MAG: sulfate permease [Alphaproteobacteria bacterium]|nr:sulfate permease [Alphaproteobacteria bacterium]